QFNSFASAAYPFVQRGRMALSFLGAKLWEFGGFPCCQGLSIFDSWKVSPGELTDGKHRCQGRPWPALPSTSIYPKVWKSRATNAAARATALRLPGPGPSAVGVNAVATKIRPTWSRTVNHA